MDQSLALPVILSPTGVEAVHSVRSLRSVVDAVGAQIDVVQDGGIRRGSDLVIPRDFHRTFGA